MNLFLHGASDFNVLQGDTLRDPKILQSGNIAKFGLQINTSVIFGEHLRIVVVTLHGFST